MKVTTVTSRKCNNNLSKPKKTSFPQATIPCVGRVMPFKTMTIEDKARPYIAMSDRLLLYPHNRTSTTVWDLEDEQSVGLLDGKTLIEWASLNNM